MKLEIEVDKEVYDYVRTHNQNLSKIINPYLRKKFKLGNQPKKPSRAYPIKKSIEYGIDWYRVNVNDCASVLSLANLIVCLYPNVSEDDVLSMINSELKRKNKYDEFDVSQRYRSFK